MVHIETQPGLLYYMDNRLHKTLEKIKKNVTRKDSDFVIALDGPEGAGKSVLAMQIGKFLDTGLELKNICMTPQEFITAVTEANKGDCIIFDEAFTGLSSRGALSEINNLLVSMMMEMRQKNLFVIIVLPTFFLLDKYVALFRSKCLIHVYTKHGRRGYWYMLNSKKKKLLYIKGKKEYLYGAVKSDFRGKFFDKYIIDEQEYRIKKMKALKSKDKHIKEDKFMMQRDILLNYLNKQQKLNISRLEMLCKSLNITISRTQLGRICGKMEEISDKANPAHDIII